MFKLIVTRGADFCAYESEPMGIAEALDTMRVLMKPSVFGTPDYTIAVSKV